MSHPEVGSLRGALSRFDGVCVTYLLPNLSMSPRCFLRREEGTVTIFGLMMLILMMAAGGMAVDLMRTESQRVKVQYTLDRAVLAAASLNNGLDPEEVVIDYFAKAGLTDYTLDVDVEEGLNFRRVAAQAFTDVDSIFLNMVGIDSIRAPGEGTAEERIMNVEISVVLDVSGSMGGSRIALMKTAAKDFVDAVVTPGSEDLISVSLISYNDRVDTAPLVAAHFPLSNVSPASTCVRFSDTEFATTGLASGTVLTRVTRFDARNNNTPTFVRDWCSEQWSNAGAILPWSNNATALKAFIDGLSAGGNTAIDLGMKWASLLLDPTTAPHLTSMIAASAVDADFNGRPAIYSDPETMKVVVLMTDGQNTSQQDIKQAYKYGDSNVWYWDDTGEPGDDGDGQPEYTLWIPESAIYLDEDNHAILSTPKGGSDAVRLTYPELWAMHPVKYVGATLFSGTPHNWGGRLSGARETYAGGSVANARLSAICTAAKNAGVLIFSIGFEAPYNGRQVMKDCASSDSHYYDVSGIEISEAFQAIARTINQLKLVQ